MGEQERGVDLNTNIVLYPYLISCSLFTLEIAECLALIREANATKKKNKKATQNKTTTSQKCAFFSLLKKKRDYNDIIRAKQAEKMTVEEDMFRKVVVVHLGSFCCYLPPEKAKVVTVAQLEIQEQDDLM